MALRLDWFNDNEMTYNQGHNYNVKGGGGLFVKIHIFVFGPTSFFPNQNQIH